MAEKNEREGKVGPGVERTLRQSIGRKGGGLRSWPKSQTGGTGGKKTTVASLFILTGKNWGDYTMDLQNLTI